MTPSNALKKPGEKAPEAGTYYCYVCAQRGEESTCEMKAGEMFLACAKCLEADVAEWDLTWKAASHRPGSRARGVASPWPGSLSKPS